MNWLNWLAGSKVAWYPSQGRALRMNLQLTIEGKPTTVAFKIDTGAPDIFVPLSMVDVELSDAYNQRKRKTHLTNPLGERLTLARFENVYIHLPMEPPFVDRQVSRVQTHIWISEDIKCGLLGMSFLEKFALLVLDFPQVEGPYGRGPHFGLLERPGSTLSLEEPGWEELRLSQPSRLNSSRERRSMLR